jgi:amino acid adenylation domain-containing protein
MLEIKARPMPTNRFDPFEKADIYQGIHQRFEKMAAQHGSRAAVKDPERLFTYAALNTVANNIARAILREIGSGPGQVAIVLANDAYAIAAIFGALKARKAYVPVDPLFPQDRTAHMLEHAEAQLIVTDQAHYTLAQSLSTRKLPMLLIDDLDLNRPADNCSLKTDPESMAYILYTSGSTGQPKGIAFGHRNLLHTTMCLINNLRVSPDDRMTQLHSTSFAASVVDIYCPLLNGAAVYPWDVKVRGLAGLAKWLMEEEVTSIQWIPTPFRRLMDTLEDRQRFESPRLLVMASEPLTRREFDLFRKYFSDDCLLVNQLGTSESYNYNLFFANKNTVFEGSNMPGGFSVSEEDREVLLLDPNGQPVVPGESGEIVIRSDYMSLGYWRNPELTKQVFLDDPEGTTKKLYRTGDLGMRLEDGCLIHLGRRDHQVKVRGYRIELTEVEWTLKGIDHVLDVVVMSRPDKKGELRLVAYYVSDRGQDLSVAEMRRQLAKKLPDYMIPQTFVRMWEFPMTPSGKIARNLLPEPDEERPFLGNELVEPKTETERSLALIWREVLQCREIGVTDNFFDLGGDSLHAAAILHLVRERCGVKLGYSALVRTPQIHELAALIDRARLVGSAGLEPLTAGNTEARWKENLFKGAMNRLLQVLALYAPGLTSLRVRLHRWRGARIGNNVAIGTAAIIETAHPELVSIGNNVAIGIRDVIIGHFSDSIDRDRKDSGPTVIIQDNVYLGPNVTILPNVTIGEGAVVTAGSVVNKSVEAHTMVQGNPARPVARCGVPLVGEGRTYEDFLRHLQPIEEGASSSASAGDSRRAMRLGCGSL